MDRRQFQYAQRRLWAVSDEATETTVTVCSLSNALPFWPESVLDQAIAGADRRTQMLRTTVPTNGQ